MTVATPPSTFALPLDELGLGSRGRIHGIEWNLLEAGEASRLRQFGFEEGVAVEPLHLGPLGRDPLAVKVGRMTVAIRRTHARAIKVTPGA